MVTARRIVARDRVKPSYQNGYARSAAESLYPQLWKGLIGLWAPLLGSSESTVRDVSGHRRDGTLTNITWSTDVVLVPDIGYGLSLSGSASNEHINIPTPINQDAQCWTWVFWFDLVGEGDANNPSVLVQYEDGGGTGRSVLYIDHAPGQGDKLTSFIDGSANQGNTGLVLGNIYQATLTKQGTSFVFYLDGVADGTFTATADAADGNVRIGCHKSLTTQGLEATIFGVALYEYALPAEMMRTSYQVGLGLLQRKPWIRGMIEQAATSFRRGGLTLRGVG